MAALERLSRLGEAAVQVALEAEAPMDPAARGQAGPLRLPEDGEEEESPEPMGSLLPLVGPPAWPAAPAGL